ncbi:MAG: Tryptophan synthase alpha chain [Myxococcaceae bacterium]|nr:Tryptophan synthase alpha chain [Myxococcaceae bacterium]
MYFPRFRDSFARDMDRRTNLRGLAFCLALLPLSCAQQLADGGNDAQAPVDRGDPGVDAGDPDVKLAPEDTGAVGGEDTPVVDPPDAGEPEDVPVAPEDVPVAPVDVGGGPVDVGGGPVDVGFDTGPADTGPRCAAPLSECGAGPCVDTRITAAHCGGCGRTCATGQSCVAGVCTLVCTAPTVACGGACVNTQTDAAHCGSCPRACATGARCLAGACVGGVIPGSTFQVALSASNCNTVEHAAVTGDDRGGIAVSNDRLFYSGDTSTGRFDLQSLVGESVGRTYDALVSNLATGTLYTLAIGSAPLTQTGGTVTTLMELNPTTGGLTSGLVNLSQPIPLPATGSVGIFSGYERIVLLGGGRAWHVSLPSGAVIDLGPVALPTVRAACENWAIWGVAEFFGNALYVDYVQSPTAIARMRVPEGTVAPLATFTALSDMCSFTVSPLWRRWYFHTEDASQFRAGLGEVAGYCDATITVPTTLPCRPIDTTCAGSCVNLQTSATNCGMCGRACAAGQTCVAGVCGVACPAGQALCGGSCVDTTSDSSNCGTCGRACIGGQWCIAGACGGGPHYSVDGAPAGIAYIDACSAPGSQRILTFQDDQAVVANVPFATHWWGTALAAGTPMAVSTNGAVVINGAAGLVTTQGMIPRTATPNGVIAPQWADQVMRSSGVCVATVGAAPARSWVAQWVDTRYYAATNSLNYEVIVHEGSGVIEFAYAAMASVESNTVGLESPDGTQAVSPCTDPNDCVAISNNRVRFTPIP